MELHFKEDMANGYNVLDYYSIFKYLRLDEVNRYEKRI